MKYIGKGPIRKNVSESLSQELQSETILRRKEAIQEEMNIIAASNVCLSDITWSHNTTWS